jgi:MATE family multidrug resistance protein
MNDLVKRHFEGPGGIREMVAIALPMVVSSACETVMTFTDRLFLSRLGPEYMSAAMGGGLSAFVMMTFFLGLTGYTTALVAQYLGSGRRDRCAITVTQALIIAAAAYPVILLARPLGHLFFDLMSIPPEQLVHQRQYFNILIYGVIFGLLRNCLSCFFSGLGRTRVVMVAALTAMVVNVGANYILIFGKLGAPALGIRGAALGTIAGSLCGLLVLTAAYLAPQNRRAFNITQAFRFDLAVMKKLFRYGYPAGLEFFLNLLAFNIMVFIFCSRSLATAASITIVFNWDMVSFVPLIGVNIGVTSLVGRYMGAGTPDTAHRATLSGLKLAWLYSFCILIAFSVFPEILVGVFRPAESPEVFNQQVFPLAVSMLRLAALYVISDAMFLVFGGALRGAGDTFWAMCISVTFHWVLVVVLYVLQNVFHTGPLLSWFSLCMIFMMFSFSFFLRYRSGKWRTLRIVEPEFDTLPPVDDGFHEPANS